LINGERKKYFQAGGRAAGTRAPADAAVVTSHRDGDRQTRRLTDSDRQTDRQTDSDRQTPVGGEWHVCRQTDSDDHDRVTTAAPDFKFKDSRYHDRDRQ
jgi:hypothetical protein